MAMTQDKQTYIAMARQKIANAEIRLALDNITSTEAAELWQLVDGLEATLKKQAVSLEEELEQVDRELEQRFRRRVARMK
jgi:hypothetical protein